MRKISFFILILLGFFSCETELVEIEDLNLSNASLNFDIAISGFISNEKATCLIKISQPVSIQDSIQLLPLNEASIELKTEDETYSFYLSEENGIYLSEEKIQGKPGNVYSLEVTYNEKTYFASDTMPAIGQDDFKIPFSDLLDNDDGFMSYKLSQHNFGFQNPSIWTFSEGYQSQDGPYILPNLEIQDFYNIRTYAHRGSIPQGLFPSGFLSTYMSGNKTDSLEIVKMNISEGYYQYLLSVFNIRDWNTGIFATISGNTTTNISNGGIGYFYTINTQRKRLTYEDCNN